MGLVRKNGAERRLGWLTLGAGVTEFGLHGSVAGGREISGRDAGRARARCQGFAGHRRGLDVCAWRVRCLTGAGVWAAGRRGVPAGRTRQGCFGAVVRNGFQGRDDRERVLDAAEIADVVGERCALKPKGREFVCLCPFHDDRNPSMFVVPHKRMFHCFVCGTGGNAIDFVMKYHGMGFREALETLAERHGVEIGGRGGDGEAGRAAGEAGGALSRDALLEANGFAMRFFRSIFAHREHGAAAREAAAARDIDETMVEAFAIGASPDRFDGLVSYARSKGQSLETLEAAGLVKRSERGGWYDALRNRLIFPILDQAGRPVAFGGRILNPEDTPKYLNSPETKVFQKGSVLFGVRQAWAEMRRTGVAVVTEGYTDVIACHRAGFGNVVATLGTALTDRHARLLRRAVDRVVLLFDGDEAGRRAADRAFEVFFSEPVDVSIAALPGGEDPADLLSADGGRERFAAALTSAVDAMEFRFGRLTERLEESGHGVGSQSRARLVEEDLGRLVDLGLARLPPIRRRSAIRRYAAVAGVDEGAVVEAFKAQAARNAARGVGRAGDSAARGLGMAAGSPRTAAEHALGVLLASGNVSKLAEVASRSGAEPFGAELANSAGDGEENLPESQEFVDAVRTVVSCGAYSSPVAGELAQVVGRVLGVETRVDPPSCGSVSSASRRGADSVVPGSASSGGGAGSVAGAEHGGAWREDLLGRVEEESQSEEARGLARSFAIALERLSGGDLDRLGSHWLGCVREVKRAASSLEGASADSSSGVGDGSGGESVARVLAARRASHGSMGGNPRAMPRPRG